MLLKNGKKYAMIQEGNEVQLQIHDLTSQDSGIYRCCAGNLETRSNIIVKGRFVQYNMPEQLWFIFKCIRIS